MDFPFFPFNFAFNELFMVANRECHKGDKGESEREGTVMHKIPTVVYILMMIMVEEGR